MPGSLRKYIGFLAGILIFFQLFQLKAGASLPAQNDQRTVLVHTASGHSIVLHTEARVSRLLFKLPDQRRKYFLSESDDAVAPLAQDVVLPKASCVSFTGEAQQHIRPRSVSFALLRGPPIA